MNAPWSEFREDGWPLCPACGEDELYAGVHSTDEADAYKRNGMKPFIWMIEACYRCHWSPRMFFGPHWQSFRNEGLLATHGIQLIR